MAVNNKTDYNYKFEKHFAITIIILTALALGLLFVNIFSDRLEDGIRDFIAEQGIWAKSQKTATINLIYYIRSGDKAKYRIYKREMNKLLKEKEAMNRLKEGRVSSADSLFTFLLSRLTEDKYRDLDRFYEVYSSPGLSFFVPGVDLFRQAFATRERAEQKLLKIQVLGKKIVSAYHKGTLSQDEATRYSLQLYSLDAQLTSLTHNFTYDLSDLSRTVKRYALFNLIAVGLVLLLTGGISSYLYIRNLRRWKKRILDQNNELQLIFANTMEAIFLVEKGGKIVNGNTFALELLSEKSIKDLKEKNFWDVLRFNESDEKKFRKQLQKNGEIRETLPIYKSSGDRFIGEVSASVAESNNGEKLYCIAIQDETETLEYLSKINASEKTYRDLLDSIQDAILIQNKEGRIIQTNPAAAQMFGYEQSELEGKMPKEILAPQSLEQFNPRLFKQALSGERKIFNRWARTKDNTVFPIETTLSKCKFFGEEVIIGIIRDITDRHEAIKELQEANQRNQVLLQEIHHRVKNNMALISGLIQLQAFDVGDSEVQSILVKSQKRIHAVAYVHEHLYQSGDLVSIEFKSFLQHFIGSFEKQNITHSRNDILISTPSFTLNINQAIPTALLLNEIIMHILENCVSREGQGEISIDIELEQDLIVLDIVEKGDYEWDACRRASQSLEFDIINNLVRQLDATLETAFDGQCRYKITFERKKNIKGIGSSGLNLN